ncbi:hypothetical protein RRG08_062680 [Elysia crispata]|uniref:Uncharacterized protein n=1 Tax=Elysia crispata TaxID=231223 RepID=A0AAE0XND4_9GAST|nr:hypothetical protein RRG08_062680 [Elysia crispata]
MDAGQSEPISISRGPPGTLKNSHQSRSEPGECIALLTSWSGCSINPCSFRSSIDHRESKIDTRRAVWVYKPTGWTVGPFMHYSTRVSMSEGEAAVAPPPSLACRPVQLLNTKQSRNVTFISTSYLKRLEKYDWRPFRQYLKVAIHAQFGRSLSQHASKISRIFKSIRDIRQYCVRFAMLHSQALQNSISEIALSLKHATH